MNIRKKILFVVPSCDPSTHFVYVLKMVEELSKEFDTFLIIEKASSHTPIATVVYQNPYTFVPFRFLNTLRLLALARMRGYRTVYIHYSFLAVLIATLSTHAFTGRVFYWNSGLPWLYRRSRLVEWMEWGAYHMIDYLIVGSDAQREGYSKAYSIPLSRIKSIYAWVDEEKLSALPPGFQKAEFKRSLGVPPEKRVALFIHRLARRKGAHMLPAIAEALHDEDCVVVVGGDGPERGNIERDISARGITNLILCGAIPNRSVPAYYAIADVFLLPSEEEGTSRSLLEAMAMGIPSVTFAVGGIPEAMPKGLEAYVLPAGDEAQFIAATLRLLRSSTEQAKHKHLMKEHIHLFSKQRILKQFSELLAE